MVRLNSVSYTHLSQIASIYLKNNQGQMTGAISVSEEIKTDAEAPAATIKIENNEFKEFLNTITFGLFFKETKEIEIESADNERDVYKRQVWGISGEDTGG